MITLDTKYRFDDFERIFDRLSRPSTGDQRVVTDAIREGYATNFRRQGSAAGPWVRLAPATVAQRRRLGFGPTPILVRKGTYLNTFTQSGDNDHIERVKSGPDGVTYEVGSSDKRASWLNEGTSTIPARPVDEFDGQQEDRIFAALEAVVEMIRI